VERLDGIETVLLDLDGTLYVGSRVVEGAPEAVRRLRERGLAVRFCTNTDSVTPGELVERLAGRGFEVGEDELVTPVAVAVQMLGSDPRARVLAVAADGVRELLGERLAGPGEAVTHVLVADPSYGAAYGDLDAAFRAVRDGAELLATQVNRVAVRDDGAPGGTRPGSGHGPGCRRRPGGRHRRWPGRRGGHGAGPHRQG
jgi:ribonucleotide monophosphatase NagD (HAD superfamily)